MITYPILVKPAIGETDTEKLEGTKGMAESRTMKVLRIRCRYTLTVALAMQVPQTVSKSKTHQI